MFTRGDNKGSRSMKNAHSIKTILATALLASAGAFTVLGLDAGIARADTDPNYGPHQWCPGVRKDLPPNGPGTGIVWDWNVCHTFFNVGYQASLPAHFMDVHPLVGDGVRS
jgi:hypothetical protein